METIVDRLKETKENLDVYNKKQTTESTKWTDLEGAEWWRLLWVEVTTLLKPIPQGSFTQAGVWASTLRVRWDLLQAALLFFTQLLIPMRLAHSDDDEFSAFAITELCIDVVLLLDVPLSACTPYQTPDNRFILDPRKVVSHYVHTALLFDVFLGLPIGAMLLASGASTAVPMVRLVRVLQALRVLKALRKARSACRWHRIARWVGHIGHGFAHVLSLLFMLFLTWHWMGCIWWFIITNDDSAGKGRHAGVWFVDDVGGDSARALSGTTAAYLISMHWAASVTTCIGTPPLGVCSRWQAAMESITCATGVVMQSAFFGAAAEAYGASNEAVREKRRKLAMIQSFIRTRSVPPNVGKRVADYYAHMTTRMKPSEEAKLLEELPSLLRIQIAVVLNEKYLTRVAMFKQATARSIALLSLALAQRTCLPNELILVEGAFNDKLYLVRSGTLSVHVQLHDGNGLWGMKNAKEVTRRNSMPGLLGATPNSRWNSRTISCTLGSSVAKCSSATSSLAGEKQESKGRKGSRSAGDKPKGPAAEKGKDSKETQKKQASAKEPRDSTWTQVNKLGKHVATIREGQAFGEQSFLARTTSKATIATLEFCELMSLHRRQLEAVFSTDPGLRATVDDYLEEQMTKYKKQNAAAAEEKAGRRRSFTLGNSGASGGFAAVGKSVLEQIQEAKEKKKTQKRTQFEGRIDRSCRSSFNSLLGGIARSASSSSDGWRLSGMSTGNNSFKTAASGNPPRTEAQRSDCCSRSMTNPLARPPASLLQA